MKKKALWIIPIVAVLAAVMAGVLLLGNRGNIQELRIVAKPFVTVYEQGEAFDPAGLIVEATDKDGLRFTLREDQYSLQSPKLDTPGKHTVTVKCGGKTAAFTVTVKENLAITALELDTSYINYYFLHNDEYTIEKSGLIVYAVLADGSRKIVNDYEHTAVDTSIPGKKQVTVSYNGLTASYEIEVVYGVHFVPIDPRYNEKEYLYLDWNSDAWTPANSTLYHRSADGNKQSDGKNIGGYFVYYIDYGAKLESLTLLVQTRLQSKVEVSFDNVTYQSIDTSLMSNNISNKQYNLAVLLDGQEGHLNFEDNSGRVYYRFSDPSMEDGFGADLYDFKTYYNLSESASYVTPIGYYTDSYEVSFRVGDDMEKTLLAAESGSAVGSDSERGNHRFNNTPNSYFIYGIDFGGNVKMLDVALTMQGQVKLEVSMNGYSWQVLTDNAQYQPYAQFTFSLGNTLKSFENNTGRFYLRFTDHDKDGAFGADLFDITFRYALGSGVAYKEPVGLRLNVSSTPTVNADHTTIFLANTDEEKVFLFDSKNTGIMSDDQGAFRFIDGMDTYIVYAIDVGSQMSDGYLATKVGQKHQKIEISFDGGNWTTVRDVGDNDGPRTLSYHLKELPAFKENTGRVYVRLTGGSAYTGGFGITMYSMKLAYDLVDDSKYTEPVGVEAAQPSNTYNHELTFLANTDEEETFLFDNKNTGIMSDDQGTLRFIDGMDTYIVYGMDAGSAFSKASVTLKIGQKYQKVEFSFDGTNWTEVLNTVNTNGPGEHTYDLSSIAGFESNNGQLYIRLSGGTGYTGGFGITFYRLALRYTLENEALYTAPIGIAPADTPDEPEESHELTFLANTDEEKTFLFDNKNTGIMSDDQGTFRFIDGMDTYIVYGIDVGSAFSKASVTLKIGQKYQKVEFSFDGTNWTEVLNTVNTNGPGEHTYDLSSITGFESNNGQLYIRLSGGTGYTGGFGITFYHLALQYTLENEALYTAPTGIAPADTPDEPEESHVLTFLANTDEEKTFLFDNKNTGIMSDDQGTFRFIDGMDTYIVYGINVGSAFSKGSVTLKIGQKYQKVEFSFDGTNWTEVLNTVNTSGPQKHTYDLSSIIGFESNNGQLYIRLSGGTGYTGGFGITAYSVELEYTLVDENSYDPPTGI